jgi:hypothetical protein
MQTYSIVSHHNSNNSIRTTCVSKYGSALSYTTVLAHTLYLLSLRQLSSGRKGQTSTITSHFSLNK